MKRIVGVILSFVLFSTNIVASQTPSDIFSNDYQGEARPFTNSGFQNRWIEMMLTEYDLSFDDLKTEENYYYFELDEALKVAFEESFIGSGDSVIFKLSIFDNEQTDFESIMNLVRMFDTEVDEAAIE